MAKDERIRFLTLVTVIVMSVLLCRCGTDHAPLAIRDPKWDDAFTCNHGWTGGDIANSVNLRNGRTLWLFGDSWIGTVVAGKHKPGSTIVHNTIAIQFGEEGTPWKAPDPAALHFYWKSTRKTKQPEAWFEPNLLRLRAIPAGLVKESSRIWSWPTGDAILAPDSQGKPRLIMFYELLTTRINAASVWNFSRVGGVLAVVGNPTEVPVRWHLDQFYNPYVMGTTGMIDNRGLQTVNWGSALQFVHVAGVPGNGYIFIYGVKKLTSSSRVLLLARAPSGTVENFDSWRFFTRGGEWSADPNDASPLVSHIPSELSIDRVVLGGVPKYVMVHSEENFGRRIMVRVADRLQGLWSAPLAVFTAPLPADRESYFAYGARAHPHLSRPRELLISYVINSTKFSQMIADASIYRPRFVRLNLDVLASRLALMIAQP